MHDHIWVPSQLSVPSCSVCNFDLEPASRPPSAMKTAAEPLLTSPRNTLNWASNLNSDAAAFIRLPAVVDALQNEQSPLRGDDQTHLIHRTLSLAWTSIKFAQSCSSSTALPSPAVLETQCHEAELLLCRILAPFDKAALPQAASLGGDTGDPPVESSRYVWSCMLYNH